MYQYIYNSRCYQRCISIFIVVGAMYQYIYNSSRYQRCMYNSRRYQRCISIFIIVGVTRDVSVYL